MLLIVLFLIGLVGVVSGVRATCFVYRQTDAEQKSHWRVQRVPLLAGIVLALAFACLPYPVSASARVVGFPVPAVGFEKKPGGWADFIGPATLPAMMIDALFGLAVPQLLLAHRLRRRKRGTPTPPPTG